ncbi:MAG TPA: hypothetical protein EYG80_03855 [Flavobacteriaceae bacterium]|nr:hypothetical protein [Flavobacteriaceae bacterium]
MNELKIILTNEMISKPLDLKLPSKILYIDRSEVGLEKERSHNLIGFAQREPYIKDLLSYLASSGFYLVASSNGISKFEKFINAESFKHNIKVKDLQIYKDIYYTLDEPLLDFEKKRLIVLFSSVADFAFNADIARRNFFVNFSTIRKYIPQNTYVLRIGDIGGVLGNFYMNTTYSNTIEENIQDLIKFILVSNNITKKNVVLYGASKGGTATLYHSILGGYKSIAVDPIVSDEYHEEHSFDSHFTQPRELSKIYPQTKQEKFTFFIKNRKIPDNITILYSQNSPIYEAINSIIKENDKEKKINYLNVCHPQIKTHPDVAAKTINVLMLVMNNLFYGLSEIKSKNIDCDKATNVKKLEIKAELKLTKLIIYTDNKSISLRVYDADLEKYKDIVLKESISEISLFKLKGKMISIVEIGSGIEHELVVDLKKSSVLSKIASYKNVVIEEKEFSFLVIE